MLSRFIAQGARRSGSAVATPSHRRAGYFTSSAHDVRTRLLIRPPAFLTPAVHDIRTRLLVRPPAFARVIPLWSPPITVFRSPLRLPHEPSLNRRLFSTSKLDDPEASTLRHEDAQEDTLQDSNGDAEYNSSSTAGHKFPPNASAALVGQEAPQTAPSAATETPRTGESLEANTASTESLAEPQQITITQDVDIGSPRPSLRQATRVALASIPGGAYAIMQQQYFLTRHLALRYRAWRTRRSRQSEAGNNKNEQVEPSPPSVSLGRRSTRRRSRRKKRQPAKASQKPLSALPSGPFPSPETSLASSSTESQKGSPSSSAPTYDQLIPDSTPDQPSVKAALGGTTIVLSSSSSSGATICSSPSGAPVSVSSPAGGVSTSSDSEASSVDLPTKGVCDQSELMRHYEAVLQMVLSSGVVEPTEKRFLSEYRKRCNISDEKHVEALKRLGWNLSEFQEGALSSMSRQIPSWRKALNRFVELCEVKGNYIVTVGSIASLTSIMMASMVHLRMLQLIAGVLYFGYNITRRPPLVSAAYWNLVFFAINAFMLLRLMLERRPETFSDAELDVFERHFLSSGLSPRQFKKLLSIATWKSVPEGEVLVHQGKYVDQLIVLYRGKLTVLINGSEVETLEGGDANAIIGLRTFLTRVYDANQLYTPSPPKPAGSNNTAGLLSVVGGALDSAVTKTTHNANHTTNGNTASESKTPSKFTPDGDLSSTQATTDEENHRPGSQSINALPKKQVVEDEAVALASSVKTPTELQPPNGVKNDITSDRKTTSEHFFNTSRNGVMGSTVDSAEVSDTGKHPRDGSPTPTTAGRGTSDASCPDSNSKPDMRTAMDTGELCSSTSVVAAEDCVLLVWPMDELVSRVKGDPVNIGFPLLGGMAKSLVARSRTQKLKQSLTSYEAVMQAVLSDGEARPEEKHFLRECRQKFDISEEDHWAVLSKLGWSREEFEDGAKHGVILQPANRAIRAILSIVTEQRRRGNAGQSSTDTP